MSLQPTEQTTQHTPPPWHLDRRFDGAAILDASPDSDDGHFLLATFKDWGQMHDGEANAEFTVRAVNAHADLLAACKAALLDRHPDQTITGDVFTAICQDLVCVRLRAAIAKAEKASGT